MFNLTIFYTKGILLDMKKRNFLMAIIIVVLVVFLGFALYTKGKKQDNYGFSLGLDLSGGVELLYKADV